MVVPSSTVWVRMSFGVVMPASWWFGGRRRNVGHRPRVAGCHGLQPGKVGRGEVDVGGRSVLFHALGSLGAGDGDDVVALGQ